MIGLKKLQTLQPPHKKHFHYEHWIRFRCNQVKLKWSWSEVHVTKWVEWVCCVGGNTLHITTKHILRLCWPINAEPPTTCLGKSSCSKVSNFTVSFRFLSYILHFLMLLTENLNGDGNSLQSLSLFIIFAKLFDTSFTYYFISFIYLLQFNQFSLISLHFILL